jgi:hypothetical protein
LAGERASEGRGCCERGTLNVDRKANGNGELTVQLLHICCLGFAEVAQNKQNKRMLDDTVTWLNRKPRAPSLLSDYLFAHSLAFAIVR